MQIQTQSQLAEATAKSADMTPVQTTVGDKSGASSTDHAAMMRARQVSVFYGAKQALFDVNLDMPARA
ncbi:MAG: hypothetical protein SGJ17_09265, partial [Hyphomicrobiales bacterium]|nr:hypothetical protein [Hyphomicrobiales bacterium]